MGDQPGLRKPRFTLWYRLPTRCELGAHTFLCWRSGCRRLYGHGQIRISAGTAWVVGLSLAMHVDLSLILQRHVAVIRLEQVGNRGRESPV